MEEKLKEYLTRDVIGFLLGIVLVLIAFNAIPAIKGIKITVSDPILKGILLVFGLVLTVPSIWIMVKGVLTSDKPLNEDDTFYQNYYRPILQEFLGENKFHYIAIVDNNERVVFDIDCFHSSSNLQKNLTKGVDKHLKKYKTYSVVLCKHIQELDNKLDRLAEEGDLIRLVFDVEQGGFFLGKILSKRKLYIFAVNIVQDNMDDCTILMGKLIDKIRVEVHHVSPWIKTTWS